MIYHDGRRDSLAFFREHRDLIGEIKSVTLVDYNNVDVMLYCFKIVGEMGEIWLSNWYLKSYVDTILRALGYPEEAIDAATKNEFDFGPPNRWKPKLVRRVTMQHPAEATLASAEEVLDFIHEYYIENNEIMPTAKEIRDGCDSVVSISMAHSRLYLLRDRGEILIQHRKTRGIVLL